MISFFDLAFTYNVIVILSLSVVGSIAFMLRNQLKISLKIMYFDICVKYDTLCAKKESYLKIAKEHTSLAILMYTTNVGRLCVLFIPPIMTVIFVQLNNKMYDYDKLNTKQSLYFLMTNVLMVVSMHSVSGIFLWYLTEYRMYELMYELEELKIKLGTYLPTCNKKRIDKAIKNVFQITNIYYIPINVYKSIVSVIASLWIIDGVYFKLGLVGLYLCVLFISRFFTSYMEDKTTKDVIFDPTTKNGYEDVKTKEESNPLNIINLENASEVYSRLTLSHSIVNNIDSKMTNETKRAIKYAFRSTLIDTAGAIIFIVLLNVSTRSVAQSASSLCWIVSTAFDSFSKWKKVYYLQEHAHLLKKLKQHEHICNMKENVADPIDIKTIELINVNFEYQSDILIEAETEPQLAIKNLSCKFEKGKLNYITGENGGGKSSFFKTLLYNIKSGMVLFDGINRNQLNWLTLRRSIYYLSQINEHPAMLSEEILTELKKENTELAEKFGLADIANVSGSGQGGSGGQEQRLHIFTALVSKASVILLDEPFSALDVEWKDKVEDILIELAKTKIIIMIGHDCFNMKANDVKQYTITPFKKSVSGNTELNYDCV